MTSHMFDFIRNVVWHVNIPGPVLEIGSYVEAGQDHINMRMCFPPGTSYMGMDTLSGTGVDRQADLLNEAEMKALQIEFKPNVVLCLYVIEHIWKIKEAAKALAGFW